jgi:hypothetical protein
MSLGVGKVEGEFNSGFLGLEPIVAWLQKLKMFVT